MQFFGQPLAILLEGLHGRRSVSLGHIETHQALTGFFLQWIIPQPALHRLQSRLHLAALLVHHCEGAEELVEPDLPGAAPSFHPFLKRKRVPHPETLQKGTTHLLDRLPELRQHPSTFLSPQRDARTRRASNESRDLLKHVKIDHYTRAHIQTDKFSLAEQMDLLIWLMSRRQRLA